MKELFSVDRKFHGPGKVTFRWDPTCKLLATCGSNGRVRIYERNGEIVDELALEGRKDCAGIAWDKDGETCAVIQDGTTVVKLWTRASGVTDLETNLDSPSMVVWSRTGPQLAIGTAKGNLLIYNAKTLKKIPARGKHSKKITCGMWNLENRLALAGNDKVLSISDDVGNTLDTAHLKYDPEDVQFAEQKLDEKYRTKENTVSCNMGKQTILLYNLTDPDSPVELAFQAKYGDITSYRWFGDGYMLIGFSKGYVIAISTHMKEIGEELQSIKIHEQELLYLVYSDSVNKFACCGDDGLRVVDMSDWKEVKEDYRSFTKDEGDPLRLQWTQDGQILSVVTDEGYLFNYLMSIPVVGGCNGTKLAFLSSLRHVAVMDVKAERSEISIEIAVEPTFIAAGPNQIAVGMNNHCWFYNCDRIDTSIVNEQEYMGTVKSMCLNANYAAALASGKCQLHTILPSNGGKRAHKTFPQKGDAEITSIAMTPDFLIYSTNEGHLITFYLKDWAPVNEYRHESAITAVYPNNSGTRIVFVDSSTKGWLYSPVDDHCLEIEGFPSAISNCLWDPADAGVFAVFAAKVQNIVTTFCYSPMSSKGPIVTKVSSTKLPKGFCGLSVLDGQVHGQKGSGALTSVMLSSHEGIALKDHARKNPDKVKVAVKQLLSINRLKAAWNLAQSCNSPEVWGGVGAKAMEQLDIDMAWRVFVETKDTAMAMAIQSLKYVEDKNLLAGHVCMLNGNYNDAQVSFLASTSPLEALQMRRDLLHWDHALMLAEQLAKDEIPTISREYASQLEVKGEFETALDMYERALRTNKNKKDERHINISKGGIARMTLRLGDLHKGRSLALESNDKVLMKECAAILESMKQYSDAAELYVKAEQYEKAAMIYNMTKNFTKAAPLMDKITTPKLHAQYGKAKEAEGQYEDACIAYERAKDFDSVIRLQLTKLNNPQKAFQIVRRTKSDEGASLVAAYCVDHKEFQAAIEFLLMAKRSEEAFQIAVGHREMNKFAIALGDGGTMDDYLKIANYYEQQKDAGNAGKFYAICEDYNKAIKFYMQCGDEKIDASIKLIEKIHGKEGSDVLVRQLHDFLIGEHDGQVKDANYVFRLYMAIGEYGQAANTAILIANQEQKIGNYQVAHSMLFETHQDLVQHKIPIPAGLSKNLLLLHSYILVKKLVKANDHVAAARMLIRVAKSISKFPSHVVPILTSTVIECQRANLKRSSFDFASMLMRNEYRSDVDKRYKRKIEAIVRRPDATEGDEPVSPCPFCDFELPQTSLECPSCKNSLPYCCTTGRHMEITNWCVCPSCRFPSLYSDFLERIKSNQTCCMCNQTILLSAVVEMSEADARKMMKPTDDDEDSKPTDEDGEDIAEDDSPTKKHGVRAPHRPKQANW